ncbi:MAG: PLAT/LH2 domain-containing protein [Pseudomonadota bacterium]
MRHCLLDITIGQVPSKRLSLGVKALLTAGAFLTLSQAAFAETAYTITTVTGQKGTNADITVKLHGTEGSMERFSRVLDNPGVDDFEPRQTNKFVIYNQTDLGIITDVEIQGPGLGLKVDPWDMKSMTVSSNGAKSKGKSTRFTYSNRIDQDDIERDFPKHKALLLRANNLGAPKFQYNEREVAVGESWKGYGSLSGLADNRTVTFSRNDVVSSESQTIDSVGVNNTAELEVSGTIPGTPVNARALYRLEVQTQHEELRKFSRSESRAKVEEVPISVPANTMEFIKVVYRERRKIGSFTNTIENHSRYIVLEEIIATPVRVKFNYVDEVNNGYKFADLYKKAFPNQPVPTGPRKPSVQPKPAPVPQPQSQPAPKPAPLVQPAPKPAPAPVPAVTPRPVKITSSTVSYVSTTSGAAFQEAEDGMWQELSDTGTVRFNYEVIDIDEDCVYLLDIDREILIILDITRNVVQYAPDLDTEPFDLYQMSSTS